MTQRDRCADAIINAETTDRWAQRPSRVLPVFPIRVVGAEVALVRSPLVVGAAQYRGVFFALTFGAGLALVCVAAAVGAVGGVWHTAGDRPPLVFAAVYTCPPVFSVTTVGSGSGARWRVAQANEF